MRTPWIRGSWVHPPDKILFLVVILSTNLLASTVREATTCGPSHCKSEAAATAANSFEPKFQYKEGSVYSYAYTVNGTTSIVGGPATQSGLHLAAATVSLRFLTACDAFLFISNVSLYQSHLDQNATEHTFTLPLNRLPVIKSLEQHPLRFSYADGLIEEICPHSEESSWALNIKRGFLSAFQNTMSRLDLEYIGQESDVHGSCKVKYGLGTATSSALTIQKTKDLKSCGQDRFGILSSVKGTPYSFGKIHQSMPAVDSTSSCRQVVDHNLLSSVQCTESHILRSLARGAAGAYMNIVQNLELVSVYSPPLFANNATETDGVGNGAGGSFGSSFDEDEEDEGEDGEKPSETHGHEDQQQLGTVPWIITQEPNDYVTTLLSNMPLKISKRESLLFRHDYNLGQSRTNYDTARAALSKFCSSVKKEVEENAGELFEILIYILRGLSSNDMTSLSKDGAQICQGDREPLDDALEVVGTAASMAVLRDRILKGDATPQRTQSWIESLSFISKPDLSLMTEAVSILRARDNYPHILLSYSNLANSYCSAVGGPACIQDQPVIILSKLYEKYFEATGCSTRKRKEMDQALVYLKGLGNFGLYSNSTIKAVTICITKNDKNEVRVAAIEALRRMSCENGAMLPLLKSIFENQLDDAEVRIAAFLGIMRCPSYPTIRWIKQALEVEQLNQVGSFVWTYLTNLQETALPSRAELAGLLADEHFSTKFSTDMRKFSRNFEFSTFYDDANLGVGLDGNLVFSQASYLPRSTSANLTVDLFGESINVFETTLRLESFEHYVESIWQNDKSRSQHGPARNSHPTSSNTTSSSNRRREKRAILSRRKMRNLTSEYDAVKRYHSSDPTASISLRTFGKEIYYRRWVGMDEQRAALSSLNPTHSFRMGGGEDTNWQKSRLLLDSSYIIPTGAGFPLNLSAQASTIIRLESQSLIDSSGSSSSGGAFHVKGKFIPSALLAVAGSMTLSAADIHTGLKIRAHLRSSLALQGGMAMKGLKLLDVEFGFPQTQLQLLEYKSELMFMQREEFREIGKIDGNEVGSPQICSGGLFYTSLRLCSSSHFSLRPAGARVQEEDDDDEGKDSFVPYFPLNGPSHFTLSLDKANPSLLKTRFYYGWNNNQTTTELTLVTSNTIITGESGGGTQETKLGLSFNLDKESPSFDTEIILPSTRFRATGELGTDRTSGNLSITLEKNQLTVFSTSFLFKGESQSDGKITVKPILTVSRNSQTLLKAEGEVEFIPSNTSMSYLTTPTTFSGKGDLTLYGNRLNLQLSGGYNESSLSLNWETRSLGGGGTTQFRSTISHHPSKVGGGGGGVWGGSLESQLKLVFSTAPHNNLEASFKYQVEEDDVNVEGMFIQGPNPDQRELHPSNVCFQLGAHSARSHEGSRNSGLFLLIHPSLGIHWRLGGGLQTFGKSFNASINLVYAPGKSLETSVMVKRAPGVLTFLEMGWNMSLPHREPVEVSLHVQEKAPGVFQTRLYTDWQVDRLLLDLEYSDKSRRSRLDTSISLGITTKSLDNLKLGFHILTEEKETKLQLSSDYKTERYALELGHNQVGRAGKKHKFVGSIFLKDAVYVVMSELDLEYGFHALVKTVLGPKFSDIYARISATSKGGGGGMQVMGLEYRWDNSHPTPKIFLAQLTLDGSRKNVKRLTSVLTFPRYHVDGSAELFQEPERKSGRVLGKLSWRMDDDEVGHLHLNGRLGPRREKDDEAFDASLELATPFPSLKNVSLHMELDFLEAGAVCQLKFDSSWRDEKESLGGILLTRLERIQIEEEQGGGESDEAPTDDENEIYNNHHHGPNLFKYPFKLRCEGNISSTITTLKLVNFKLNHVFHTYFNTKTDLDIQLPNEKEISISSQWVFPQGWADLLSTRAELHIKTPFVGYQNVDLQGILGRKEDRDVLALIGIYVESFQYAISITGTPRFEQDGALGFDITTSNPKYDKIFGSLSYVFARAGGLVACQLGWPPQVVVGLEVGWDWVHWGDFQVYHTITTPWVPIKHVVALLKVDATQSVELKLEANEDSIKGKCEWSTLSWTNFDIRLDGNSPFEVANKFGFVFKNYWEDEVAYDSQAIGWINEQQVGFKLDGGQSEVEEEDVVAIVIHSQFELDTLVYPTIRALVSLAQRESKYDFTSSLVLQEGPINLDAKLDLLDVFRFNENITLTTPYPQLLQLEIGLSPAILIQHGLYNFGLHSKWRSNSEWHTGGLWIRWGPQEALGKILTQEARDNAFFTGTGDEDYDEQTVALEPVVVPMSQLLHFYSPLPWAKLVKVEFEGMEMKTTTAGEAEDQQDNEAEEEQDGSEDGLYFPVKKFEVAYSSDLANVSTEINNEPKKKRLMGVVNVRSQDFHPSFKVDGLLDLSESERRLSLLLGSYSPSTVEYSVSSSWTSDLPQFLQGKVDIKSPLENLEEQSGALTFAHNENEKSYSVDLELSSLTFDRFATNVMLGPKTFSMTMSTPLESLNELELRGDLSSKEGGETDEVNALIVAKRGEQELELDVDAEMSERGWPTKLTGTISTNFGPEKYRQGSLTGDVVKWEGGVNASGHIQWTNERDQLHATLHLLSPKNKFQSMNLTMETPFGRNPQQWELTASRLSDANDEIGLEFNLQTPLPQLSTLNGQALVEYDAATALSILELKKFTLKANTGDGNLGVNSTWSLTSWNKCNFGFETKYSLPVLSSYNFTTANGIKLKFKNVIPTLTHFTSLDTRFLIESSTPTIRLGAGLISDYKEGESLAFKANSKHGKRFTNFDFTSTFNPEFTNLNVSGRANATGFHSYATLQMKEGREGEAVVGWGDGRGSLSSLLQSTFNCSSWPSGGGVGGGVIGSESEPAAVMVHLHLDSIAANNTITPLISIDGSFNRISAQHSVRVQVEQGEDLQPIRLEVDLMLKSLQHFSTAFNFSSNFTCASDTGMEIYNKIDGPVFDGYLDGHWEEDRFFLKYFWDHERSDDMFKFNISLDTVLPLSTESVPKPQSAFITCSYATNSHSQRTESSFRGVYNGVQLVDSNYSTLITNSSGFEKNELYFQLDNHFWPFGLISLNQLEYSGSMDATLGDQLPTKRLRQLEVYDLNQPNLHKLEGELQIKTNFTGSKMTLTGRHPTRTVEWMGDYYFTKPWTTNVQDDDDAGLRHTSRLTWGPGNSWLGYELDLFNKTNSQRMMEQGFGFRLTYPLRVITLKTSLSHQPSTTLSKWKTELNFNAGKNPTRDLVGEVSWTLVNHQNGGGNKARELRVELKHPSLPKGLRADGRLERAAGWEWVEANLVLDHTGNLKNGVNLNVIARPQLLLSSASNRAENGGLLPHWNFSTEANLLHPGTGLELKSGLWTLHSLHELSIITLIDFKNCKKSVPEESKIAFELFKQLRKAHIMLLDPEDYCILQGQFSPSNTGNSQLEFNGEANISGVNPIRKTRISLDLQQPSFKSYAVYGKELSNGLFVEGGVIDSRNVKLDVWQVVDKLRLSDVSYFLRLNHTRLVTSKLKWRPELYSELEAYVQSLRQKLNNFASAKGEQWKFAVVKDASDSASALWDDAKGSLEPFWRELTEECDFGNDSAALQFFLEEIYTQNEFYVQDIVGFSQLFVEETFMRVSMVWENLTSYRDELTNESVQALETVTQWITTTIKDLYQQLVTAWENYTTNPWDRISSSLSFTEIKEKLYLVCYYSIGFVVKVGEAVYRSLSTFGASLLSEMSRIVQRYQPQILTHLHQIETFVYDFIARMTDYLYERKEEVMKSQYYQKLAQLAHDVDDLYRDISKNDAVANIKKFYGMLKTFLARKLSEMDDLVPLEGAKAGLTSIWATVQDWELAQILQRHLQEMVTKISWLMEYSNLDETIQELAVLLYTKGSTLFSQNILQAAARHQTAKTKFIFDADKGIISLEQKLPLPWGAFNETPNFQKLPEYESIMQWQEMFKSAKSSFRKLMLQQWTMVGTGTSLLNLLPPFDGHAMMIGPEHILTFNGLSYSLGSVFGPCNYVLVADLVDANFSVSLEIQHSTLYNRTIYSIFVTAGHNTLVLDMEQKGIRDPKRGDQLLNLPIQTPNLRGFQTGMQLVVESRKGIFVSCHVLNQICQFHVSGWYSRKVGGLLGTMDHEPSTDLTASSGRKGLNLEDVISSWQFVDDSVAASGGSCSPRPNSSSLSGPRSSTTAKSGVICHKIYRRPTSTLQPCFSTVNTDPFYEMCLMAEAESQACTSVAAYLTACKTLGVPLQTPSMCVKCEMNGEEMMDREMKVMSSPPPGSPPFLSTDVVFIVEAKECNRGFRTRRKIDNLAKHIEDQLQEHHFKQNRYAAVVFGGEGVFQQPRAVVQNKTVFTIAANIGKHFASLPTGNGSRDIFNGISYTLQHLNFRPGVSKTLILFPCSSCQSRDLTVDYAELYYEMLEKGATLHTFLDAPFPTDNKNMIKKIFGIDNNKIYTKSDASLQQNQPSNSSKIQNDGGGSKANVNTSTRRQVKVPKNLLGYCASLALQTNGSIFTTKKLQNKQDSMVNMFSTVFGDRIARTAAPSPCQTCYCTSAKSSVEGMGKVECFDCEYPKYELRPEEEEEDEDYEVNESEVFGIHNQAHDNNNTDAELDSNSSENEEEDDDGGE